MSAPTYRFYRHREHHRFRLVLRAGDPFPSETTAALWEQTRAREEADVSTDLLADLDRRGYALFMLEAGFAQIPARRSGPG